MTREDFIARVRVCERRLYRVARTLLPSEADCEDAVQEALLRAWVKCGSLREAAYFETWLIRILINQCRAFHRRRSLGETALSEDIPAAEGADRALLAALKALPERYGIALELHCIEGYSIKECAAMLRVPEGTVKWRLHQGRGQLRRTLGEEDAT